MNADRQLIGSNAEVRGALAALTSADYARILLIARSRAAGLGSYEPLDLYHEAIERILAGKRLWPLEINFVAFLAETMRSIASEVRKRYVRGPVASEADLGSTDRFLSSAADDAPDGERAMLARDLFERVLNHFRDDQAVLQLIAGVAVGETARETMGRAGLSEAEFDAARKRFRRGMPEGLAPNGDTR